MNSQTEKQPISTRQIKERLRRYTDLLREIKNQRERLDCLMETYGDPSSSDLSGTPRPKGGVSDPTANAAERITDLREKIQRKEAQEKIERAALEDLTEHMDDPDERLVIQLKYIDQVEWDDITFRLFGNLRDYTEKFEGYQRRTFRIHGRALLNLARAENGVNDSKCQ